MLRAYLQDHIPRPRPSAPRVAELCEHPNRRTLQPPSLRLAHRAETGAKAVEGCHIVNKRGRLPRGSRCDRRRATLDGEHYGDASRLERLEEI